MSYVNKMSELRLDFWFSLNKAQQRKLHEMNYSHLFSELVEMSDLLKVTNSKKIIKKLTELKRQSFRLVS